VALTRGVCSPTSESALLTFPHRFRDDLKALDWFGEHPFALARFGDGEMACIEGHPYEPYGLMFGTETWRGDACTPDMRGKLREALQADVEGYCVGLPPICCQAEASGLATRHVTCPLERRCCATIFSYANYKRFRRRSSLINLRSRSVLVAGRGGDIDVPLDAINRDGWLEPLLEKLFRLERPILVAAGPAACVIVHQYWIAAPRRQVIVDVGSVYDVDLHGHGTRMHTAGPDPRGMSAHHCRLHGSASCHPHCRPSRF
jgi:hypothetical protein